MRLIAPPPAPGGLIIANPAPPAFAAAAAAAATAGLGLKATKPAGAGGIAIVGFCGSCCCCCCCCFCGCVCGCVVVMLLRDSSMWASTSVGGGGGGGGGGRLRHWTHRVPRNARIAISITVNIPISPNDPPRPRPPNHAPHPIDVELLAAGASQLCGSPIRKLDEPASSVFAHSHTKQVPILGELFSHVALRRIGILKPPDPQSHDRLVQRCLDPLRKFKKWLD